MKKYITRDKNQNGSYVYANTWDEAEELATLMGLGEVDGVYVASFGTLEELDNYLRIV